MLTNVIFETPIKNLLRKILPQLGFELGTFRLSGASVLIFSTIEACGNIYRNNIYIM